MAPLYPAGYRNNDRCVIDDATAADALFGQLQSQLADYVDASGQRWRPVGLNPRLRLCRYTDDQHFCIHRDGPWVVSSTLRTWHTVQIYLNDSAAFVGGQTRFFDDADGHTQTFSVSPQAGRAIVFAHDLWHDGATVTYGTKYVLRSDVLYARVEDESASPAPPPLSLCGVSAHAGYAWRVVQTSAGHLATSGRDGTIALWQTNDDGYSCSERHTLGAGSVTALAVQDNGTLWAGTRSGQLWVKRGDAFVLHHSSPAAILDIACWEQSVCVACADGSVIVADGARRQRLRGHDDWVWSVVALDSQHIASASEDGTVRVWHVEMQRCVATHKFAASVRALCAVHSVLWCGLESGQVFAIDRRGVRGGFAPHSKAITSMTAHSSGMLLSTSEDCTVRLWATATGAIAQTWKHANFVRHATALADGAIAAVGYAGTLQLHHPARSTQMR